MFSEWNETVETRLARLSTEVRWTSGVGSEGLGGGCLLGEGGIAYSPVSESLIALLALLLFIVSWVAVSTAGVLTAGVERSTGPSDRVVSGATSGNLSFLKLKIDNFRSLAKLFFLDGALEGVICAGTWRDVPVAGNALLASGF